MVKVLKRKYNFLRDVSSLKKKERNNYLKDCSQENIHIICEAIHNLLNKNGCKKSKNITKKINILHKDLKKLASPNFNLSSKRKILSNTQTGDGIFSMIATTVLPFLIDLLTGKKK